MKFQVLITDRKTISRTTVVGQGLGVERAFFAKVTLKLDMNNAVKSWAYGPLTS